MSSKLFAISDEKRAEIEAHRKRMDADPEYRARMEAERLADEERDRQAYRASQERLDLALRHGNRPARGIPERLWETIDAPKATPAITAALDFCAASNPKTLLVLAGGVGTGKTVAAAIAIDRHVHGGTALLVKAIELVRHGVYDVDFWDDLRKKELLAIDDLGTEPRDEKGWAAANLDALLDARYDANRKTLITTNLTSEQFKARYCVGTGVRTLDRIREVGSFVVIPGQSMRTPVQLTIGDGE